MESLKIKVRPVLPDSFYWAWYIVDSQGCEIAISSRRYLGRRNVIRAARRYAKKFSCEFFEVVEYCISQ